MTHANQFDFSILLFILTASSYRAGGDQHLWERLYTVFQTIPQFGHFQIQSLDFVVHEEGVLWAT